ncbi:retrovirus-related pol polyprotein from transposon TNT 1-94 [Tanacetum coccineum]
MRPIFWGVTILKEEVYMSQPEGFLNHDHPNHVFKLKKALYSLKQSPRGIFINQSKYAIEMLKRYSLDQCDVVEIPMAKPNEKHLTAVKQVFQYLKGTINMVLWYPKDTSFNLTAFANVDHARCPDSRKSTSGSAQFLREKLLADIFTKALARERFEFLIKCLGMKSITPEELKHLTESDEE